MERHRGAPRRAVPSPAWTVTPRMPLAPREAFFAPNETVGAARGHRADERRTGGPLPAGRPGLAPGEMMTTDALAALRAARGDGGRIAYAADPSLATFQVVVGASRG